MKVAIFTTLLATASAFVAPSVHRTVRAPTTFLHEAAAEGEEAPSDYRGPEAISALTSSVKTVFSSEDISKILPHRYPFLLVDKVVEYEAGKVGDGHYVHFYFVFCT